MHTRAKHMSCIAHAVLDLPAHTVYIMLYHYYYYYYYIYIYIHACGYELLICSTGRLVSLYIAVYI